MAKYLSKELSWGVRHRITLPITNYLASESIANDYDAADVYDVEVSLGPLKDSEPKVWSKSLIANPGNITWNDVSKIIYAEILPDEYAGAIARGGKYLTYFALRMDDANGEVFRPNPDYWENKIRELIFVREGLIP